MLAGLMLKGLRRGKARFACAAAGIAIATGLLVFMASLAATNAAQAPAKARELLASVPAEAGAVSAMTVDFRPGGRVMQGPPMAATVLAGGKAGAGLAEGEAVVTRALFRQRRCEVPPEGTELKLVGRRGTHVVKIAGVLDWETPVRGYPNVFVSAEAAGKIDEEWRDWTPPAAEELAPLLKGDEQRRMDYATPLLLAAAFLTALTLLVNTLLLSVEANRTALTVLRTVGLTRAGTVGYVLWEAVAASAAGWVAGVLGGMGALALYVAADPAAFPAGPAFDAGRIGTTLAVLPAVTVLGALFALAPALRVRAMDAAARRPRPRRAAMAVTFACGFAAFVAVEVWGASLMRGFVPSEEWPDAIVSLLPGGVGAGSVESLRGVEGVRRVSELVPRQYELLNPIVVAVPERKVQAPEAGGGGRRAAGPNALMLAADFLPEFRFVEGTREEAERAVAEGNGVVITLMMANACGLHKGDELAVKVGGRGPRGPEGRAESRGRPPAAPGPGGADGGREVRLPIAGVVDLNWHMVTSRGLVRGLEGASPMTTGPVFCSFRTLGGLDPRVGAAGTGEAGRITHLWVEYEPEFLAEHGVFEAGRLIERAIDARLGHPTEATVRLHARDEIADGTLAHGSDVIGQAARVPFVFLAILAIGFVAMLVAEADARRSEFAVLRAVGATRGQLAARLAASAARTALWGIAAGLPAGVLAGWWASLGTFAHWAGMPRYLVVPWAVVLEGAAGAVVFALAFAVPTAVGLTGRRGASLKV